MDLRRLDALSIEAWLSPTRLDTYLRVCQHSHRRALELYEWNATMSAACMHDIGHLEVLLRNRYDVALSRAHPGWVASSHPLWNSESGMENTRRRQRSSLAYSRTCLNAATRGRGRSHGHIVANLNFGFWAGLSRAEHESTIWSTSLATVFSGRSRGPVHDDIEKLNAFRNRLAHWEPLIGRSTSLLAQLERVDRTFSALGADVAAFVGARSRVVHLLGQVPEHLFEAMPSSYLGRTLRIGHRSAGCEVAPRVTLVRQTAEASRASAGRGSGAESVQLKVRR